MASELDALRALYSSTSGATWRNNSGWLGSPLCKGQWHGVSCDSEGKVKSLHLSGNQLNGTLPTSLAMLQKLDEIDLGSNINISGTIPFHFLPRGIRKLYLSRTSFGGTIMTDVGRLQMLQDFQVQKTLISGSIPSQLAQLQLLMMPNMGYARLSGTLPSQLGNLGFAVWLMVQSSLRCASPAPPPRSSGCCTI